MSSDMERVARAAAEFAYSRGTTQSMAVDFNGHHRRSVDDAVQHALSQQEPPARTLTDAEKDTARLDWLGLNADELSQYDDGLWAVWTPIRECGEPGASVREAIDAAMQASGPEPEEA